jgi:hypothetical protein
MALTWAYHSQVIKNDIKLAGEARRQAGLRRLYIYLIAAIGLAAFLVGLSGILSFLIRSLDQSLFGTGLKQQLAWFAAVTIAGLPVWYVPWRQAQYRAAVSGAEGTDETRSLVRKIYLYFFLFVATMTMLSSVIYIVFRLISLILGEAPPTLSDLGQPVAFSVIAAGVWSYHWSVLRADSQRLLQERITQLEDFSVVVVGVGEKGLSQTVVSALERENLGVSLVSLDLEVIEVELGESADRKDVITQLNQAGLIVGPWEIAIAGGAGGAVTPEISQAVIDSPASKLLIPTPSEGWNWAGVDQWNTEAFVRQTVNAVKQILEGEEVKPTKPLGYGAIVGIIIGVLFLLIVLGLIVSSFFGF